MTLSELRCPRCFAPVEAIQTGVARCRYCGASLIASAPQPGATPFAALAEPPQNSGFLDVNLDEIGPSKIMVIKVVREHMKLGLADAMRLVEKAPCVLAKAMEGGSAKSFVWALASVGAKARGT